MRPPDQPPGHGQEIPPTELPLDCALCGSGSFETLFEAWDRLFWLPGRFALERCLSCTLVRLAPRPKPEAIGYYYPEAEYYSYHEPGPEALRNIDGGILSSMRIGMRDFVRESVLTRLGYDPSASRAQRIFGPVLVPLFRTQATYGFRGFPPFRPGGRALDVGCGSGAFLSFLQRHGWEVCGLEISEDAARRAWDNHRVRVIVGTLDTATLPKQGFDFVHMSHVLEHLHDPVRDLNEIAGLLRPGALLYVETPNAASFNARHCGPYWFPWDTPRHLHVFSPSTLKRALEEASFDVFDQTAFPHPGLYRFEDTYRVEEAVGHRLPQRPQIRWRARPRAAGLAAVRRVDSALHRLNGDILSYWAVRR